MGAACGVGVPRRAAIGALVGRPDRPWGGAPRRSRARLATFVCLLLLALGSHSRPAAARPRPDYSAYERETIRLVCDRLNLELEPHPEGKTIDRLYIEPLDVIEARDPIPRLANAVHVTSLALVIRQELVVQEGEVFSWSTVDESARLLRARRQLSLVLVLAVKGRTPGSVGVLVITKDVWSLRLNWNVQISNATITELVLQPSELNLLGTHMALGGLFVLEPDRYSLGIQYSNPRVAGSRIMSGASANVYFNRESDRSEGSWGEGYYGLPLYSMSSEWAWWLNADWTRSIERLFSGYEQAYFDGRSAGDRDGACGKGIVGCLPYEYSIDAVSARYELVRSYGRRFKLDASIGLEAHRYAFEPVDPERYSELALQRFVESEVPVSDSRTSPYLQLRSFEARYIRLLNYQTLGLQEDVQIGHDSVLRIYPAARAVASSRDLFGSRAAASYTFPVGGGFIRAYLSSDIQVSSPEQSEASVTARVHFASPRGFLGRLVYDGMFANKYQDFLNRKQRLGGEGRLRGYLIEEFVGKDILVSNLELRTNPARVLGIQIGGAAFYDVGDAVDGVTHLSMKQSVGAGARILIPQFERAVFRIDWAAPLVDPLKIDRGRSSATARTSFATLPGSLFLSFKQAFSAPSLDGVTAVRPLRPEK